jgi:Complex I intermediate-associated protein 30 (CIA30)
MLSILVSPLLSVLLLATASPSHAFAPIARSQWGPQLATHMSAASTEHQAKYSPVFDFGINTTVESFDRIDDAIMGGISTSQLRSVPSQPYASWSGICREDGGGFCGTRTLPFTEPLVVGDAEGLYLDLRLVSDDEADRRVWKISTRTEASRGEELFQAEFKIPKADNDDWVRVKVPFATFSRVRGSRLVLEGESMNVTGGIYQIGVTMSKFVIAQSMTTLENFRPGFFELQMKEIGSYSQVVTPVQVEPPTTISIEEMKQKRSLVLKMIFSLSKIFFSEKANRRKSAMKKLKEKRNMSRAQAILYGVQIRSSKSGLVCSVAQVVGIVGIDLLRTVLGFLVRYGLFKPLGFINKGMKSFKIGGTTQKQQASTPPAPASN